MGPEHCLVGLRAVGDVQHCPFALVMSTPVSIVSGLTAATRKGILVKGGVYLELGAKLSFIALDKTGTLTHGTPVQTDYRSLDEPSGIEPVAIAGSLAARSDHPVSQAIAVAAAGTASRLSSSLKRCPGAASEGGPMGDPMHWVTSLWSRSWDWPHPRC